MHVSTLVDTASAIASFRLLSSLGRPAQWTNLQFLHYARLPLLAYLDSLPAAALNYLAEFVLNLAALLPLQGFGFRRDQSTFE